MCGEALRLPDPIVLRRGHRGLQLRGECSCGAEAWFMKGPMTVRWELVILVPNQPIIVRNVRDP